MRKIYCLVLVLVVFFVKISIAQSFDIVIKGGHLIDPKNNIDAVMDVAITDGKIVSVANNIDAKHSAQTVDAKG